MQPVMLLLLLTVKSLTPGNHTVEVIYSGDGNYTGGSNSTVVDVPKVSDYEFAVDTVVDGRDVTIDVALPEDIGGVVLIDVGGVGYYANATDGKASITLSDLSNGDYTVTVTYPGDDKYDSQSNSTKFSVAAKVTPDINITVDIPENGTNGTINVELPEDATGNVTVVIDGKVYNVTDVTDGSATIPVGNLTPGNHTVEVIYSGDGNYTGASNYTTAEVPKITDYKFDVVADDIVAGQPTNITVSLPEDVTGVVLVDIDGVGYYANVTDGVGSLEIPLDLPAGTYDIVVTFPGNDKYADKTETASFKVNPDTTSIEIIVADDEIIVELPEDATGNVTIDIDGKDYTVPVENGTARLNISDLEPGNHTVDVNYPGDDKYGPASNSTTVNVPKISDYPMDITYDDGKVIVDVPDDATGNVIVKINNKTYVVPIEDGKATVDVSDLNPGDYKVDAAYPGDDKYEAGKVSDTINVPKISDYPIDVVTTDEELIVDVPDDATLDISNLTTGKHDVTVKYPGDDYYAGKTVDKVIDKTHCLYITAPDVVKYYSGPDRFIVYFKDNDRNNVDGIEVKITVNGITYTRTSKDGKASLPLNLNSGNYSIKVEFAGNSEFKAQNLHADVEVLPTIYAQDVFKVFRNGTHYYGLFLDGEGNPLVNTKVSFNIHGVFYTRTTNASGWAKLNINLEKGQYILTAINPVTGEMRTNIITVITLIESTDLTKHYRNGSDFIVRIRAADGNWAGAGEEVTFNIHGRIYTRYTDELGYVHLDVNIEPGNYIVTTYYKDCREGNSIVVLPRLITSDLTMKYNDGSKFVVSTLDEQGNPAPYQFVSFNIQGMLFDRTTDNNGRTELDINFQPGKYIVTSQYLEEREGNTIIIEA